MLCQSDGSLSLICQAIRERKDDDPGDTARGTKNELSEQVEKYERAVESAWSDVQRAQQAAEEGEQRFDRARALAQRVTALGREPWPADPVCLPTTPLLF